MTTLRTFHDLLHTAPVCPFCGHIPDETMGSQAINARVCEPCYENIHLLSAGYAILYLDETAFEVYFYLPQADEWRNLSTGSSPTPVIFLVPFPDRVTDLSEQTQKAILAYANDNYRAALKSIPRTEVASDYLDVLLPDRSPSDDLRKSQVEQLRADIATPTVVTTRRIFSPNPKGLVEETDTEPTQTTLVSG